MSAALKKREKMIILILPLLPLAITAATTAANAISKTKEKEAARAEEREATKAAGEKDYSAAIGTGMGILANQVDKAQGRKEYDRQTRQGMAMQTERGAINNRQSLDYLKNAPKAQVEGYKKAGLNVGLMYEKGGNGGSTQSTPQQPQANYQPNTGMGMQVQSGVQAQAGIELAKAAAEKAKVDAAKTAGVDTAQTVAQTASITQGINNQKAAEVLTKAQGLIAEMDVQIKGATSTEVMEQIKWTANKVKQEMLQAENATYISDKTKATVVARVNTELIGAILRNKQTEAQTTQTETQTRATSAGIQQRWDELRNQDDRETLDQKKQTMEKDLRERGLDLETARLIINVMSMGLMGAEGEMRRDSQYQQHSERIDFEEWKARRNFER